MANDYLNSLKKTRDRIIGNMRKTQGGFDDCCEDYQFIRIFDTINFNNKMNRLGITHLVKDENYNFSKIFESSIIDPIIDRSNNVFGIIGKTGSGKSELAQIITLISKKANKDFLGRDVEFFLCYTGPELHSTLKLLHKGDILWKDEMPKTEGEGSRKQKWEIENVLHTIRKLENTFIFVDPLAIKLDICDLYIESAGMNKKTRTNRFMLLNERREYFGHIYSKLHDDERLRDWYETQKDAFIRKIKNLAGKVTIKEKNENIKQETGSIIVVLATDAPLLPHQLKRLVKRIPIGLGRLGSYAGNGSGDIFIAFTTKTPDKNDTSGKPFSVQMMRNEE
ncbi:hypothetical protein LCGC14_1092530, partial [marine sediment metagenome]